LKNILNLEKHIFKDKKAVAERFAEYLKGQIEKKETFTIALSGGSTPKVLFAYLAEHYAHAIDWKKVILFWGDERCVPPTDDDSNYKMTKEHLLEHISIPEENIFRIKGENDPEEEARRYALEGLAKIRIAGGWPQFDMVMLGMGEDGHTASIFPHQMELLTSGDYCAVATHPESGQRRITLTGKVINNAENVSFLVTGAGKREKVKAIFNQQNGYKHYPAAHINPVNGELHWWMDEAAA